VAARTSAGRGSIASTTSHASAMRRGLAATSPPVSIKKYRSVSLSKS
jgi:hypothetical protein